jgi:hypothetical protein
MAFNGASASAIWSGKATMVPKQPLARNWIRCLAARMNLLSSFLQICCGSVVSSCAVAFVGRGDFVAFRQVRQML